MSISLGEMNEKERQKEFKRMCKDVKSKDHAVRTAALKTALKEPTYLIDGRGVYPLLEGVSAKKKSLDISIESAASLLKYLSDPPSHDSSNSSVVMRTILESKESFDIFQNLSDLLCFKTEVKKKPGMPDDVEGLLLEAKARSVAAKTLSLFACEILSNASCFAYGDNFSKIPSVMPSLLSGIKILSVKFSDGAQKDTILDEVNDLLACIAVVAGYSEALQEFILSSDTLELFPRFVQEPALRLNTLRVYRALFSTFTSLQMLSSVPDHLDALYESVDVTAKTLVTAIGPQTVAAPAKGKKDDKKKDDKTATERTEGSGSSDTSPQKLLLCLTIEIELFIEFGRPKDTVLPLPFSEIGIEKILNSLNSFLLIPDVWKLIQGPSLQEDVPIRQLPHLSCTLVSTIAAFDPAIRTQICQLGAIKLISSLLLQSRDVIGAENLESAEGNMTLSYLLRASEQAILLLCSKEVGSNQQEQASSESSCFRKRSIVSEVFETDMDLFISQTVPFSTITDLLSSPDAAVTSRIARIIGILISSSSDPQSFLSSISLSPTAITFLSKFVSQHASNVVDPVNLPSTASVSVNIEISSGMSLLSIEEEESRTRKSHTNESASSALFAITHLLNETLSLKGEEVLCWLLRIFELVLRNSPDNIKTFSSKENISILAKLLYQTGPTANENCEPEEKIISVFDPREHSVYSSGSQIAHKIIFRSYVMDLLSLVVESDPKLREYGSGSIPIEPGTALSDSVLQTIDAVDLVGKTCVDPCVSILMAMSTYGVSASQILKVFPTSLSLNLSVLNSSLNFLSSIASSGIFGLTNAVNSIAFPQSPGGNFNTALSIFKQRLGSIFPDISESLSSVDEAESFKSSPTAICPLLFDDVLKDISNILMSQEMLRDSPCLWPLLVLTSAIIGILSNPNLSASTQEITMSCVKKFSKAIQFNDSNQPAVVDIFSGLFLSLGGAVTLAGIGGKFGTLKNEPSVLELLLYLYSRGAVREAFWGEFAQTKPPVDTAPAAKGGKAAPPAKGKGKDPQEAPSVVYPSLPDSTHPDPNHGPNRAFWARLLSQCADDNYSYASNAPPIAVCLLGLLQEQADMLVKCGVDVNITDSFGLSPLMYALFFSFRDLSISLLQQGADIDAIDQAGNPVIKYALLSILDLTQIPSEHCFNIEDNVSYILGRANVLDVILQNGVDLRVCDAEGNYPLHVAASFGSIDMSVGGYFISVRSEAYISSPSLSPILTFEQLCNAGAEVNTCSKNGLAPLHICSLYSDIESMQFLFAKGSIINIADTYGFLPLHYCFSGGHSRALDAAKILLELGVGRPIRYALFDDKRTGKSKDMKVSADIESSLEEIYSEVLIPTSIEFKRTTEKDLLLLKTFEGTNLMQLTLSGHTLVYDNLFFVKVASDIRIRSQLVEFLLGKISSDVAVFYCNTDNFGTTLLHAMSLFFVGETPVEAVCPKRRVNPIFYGNIELQLLDYVYSTVSFDANVSCSRAIQEYSAREVFPETWYPVMGSLFSKNLSFCQSLITRGADLKMFDAIEFSTKCIVNDSFSVGIKGLLAMREQQKEDHDYMYMK